MKKYLGTIIISLLAFPIIAGASLYEYYRERDEKLPTVAQRASLANSYGIEGYTGTETQNRALEAFLRGEGELGATLPIAGNTYNLAGSGVTGSATSLTLQSFTIKQTGQPIVDADLSDTFYLTIEPGNNNRQEILSCTTVVQNSNGTATISGCSRGMSPITPYTASTTLQFSHAGGTQVIFSDPPQLFNEFGRLQNANTWLGDNIFASSTAPLDQRLGLGTTSPAYFTNNAGTLYFCNFGASCTAIGAGASTYNFLPSLRVSGSEVGIATSSAAYWFVLRDNNFTVATGTGTGIVHEIDRVLNATTTLDNMKLASTTMTGNTLIQNNATTTGSFNVDGRFLVKGLDVAVGGAATTTVATTTHSGSGSTTLFTYAVPANTLGTDGYIKVTITASSTDSGSGTVDNKLSIQYGGQEACAFNNSNNSNYYLIGLVYGECTIIADNATNKQGSMGWWISHGQSTSLSVANGTAGVATSTGQTIDSTSAQNITIVASASDAGDSLGLYRALVQIFKF